MFCNAVAVAVATVLVTSQTAHRMADQQAGAWPAAGVKGLVGAAQWCCKFRPAERATVADVLPKLEKLARLARR